MEAQAQEIAAGLMENQVAVESDREIIALIAYLQRLGTDIAADPDKEYKDYEVKPESEQE
jgi:cytochrome c oxidase cbb3-type subunit I/II